MRLKSNQVNELLEIIESWSIKFIGERVGTEILTKEDKNILKRHGIILKKAAESDIETAYKFGILSEALGHKTVKEMDYDKFKSFLRSKNFVPLNNQELTSIEYLKNRAYNDIKSLTTKIQQDVGNAIYKIQQRKTLEKVVKEKAIEAIENRKSISQLASDLRNNLSNYTRDFDRIADFLMHEAYSVGRVASMMRESGDNIDDIEVYFVVHSGACDKCCELLLTNGFGSEPKVFKLADIIKNGNNIGFKQAEWVACMPPIHPYCRCDIARYKAGRLFNPRTRTYSIIQRDTQGIKRQSKVKITVTKRR